MILASVSRMTAMDHLMPLGGGANMIASTANGKAVLVSCSTTWPVSTSATSKIGGQVEQNIFRFRMAVGSLLKAGLLSGLDGLAGAMRGGTAMLASFDSTAPDADMPRNVAHKATTARSTAQRYFRKRVSTVCPTQEQHRGQIDAAANVVIPATYGCEIREAPANLASPVCSVGSLGEGRRMWNHRGRREHRERRERKARMQDPEPFPFRPLCPLCSLWFASESQRARSRGRIRRGRPCLPRCRPGLPPDGDRWSAWRCRAAAHKAVCRH